ncbi:MAG: type VII toxin-antitoxin system HepT family RNase toxin [Zhaonellaceae bacterium]|jgi:uncharacterized protein YutE (UPF0331/DUF86 family)|nr:DUF86 domain-containing protein [Clostridia bacterium]
MFDKEKIRSKIQIIEDNMAKLSVLSKYSYEFFKSDFRNVEAAKHLLQVNIEVMIDIANHIIARNRWKTPETSAASLRLLAQHDYFGEEKLKTFEQMVKFRNRIVHLYYDVDDKEIYDILKNKLDDFKYFIKSIIAKVF